MRRRCWNSCGEFTGEEKKRRLVLAKNVLESNISETWDDGGKYSIVCPENRAKARKT
jgi:hypothetical protein